MTAAPEAAALRAGSSLHGLPARLQRLFADAALVLLVFAVYAPSLEGGFVFDDRLLVVENEMIAEPPWDLASLFGPTDAGRIAYRPIRMLSYRIDHALAGGLDPWVFHLSNLLWHAAAVLAVHALARATLGVRSGAPSSAALGAFFAAAFFAVHPLGSEAVAYVSGRRDLLCALFGVLALRAWWGFLERAARRGLSLGLALLLAVLALGAKETALALPILAGLLAILHARHSAVSLGAAGRNVARAALATLVIALVLYPDRFVLAWHRIWLGPLAPQPALSLQVLGDYLWLAIWPVRLSADYRLGAYDLPQSPFAAPALLAGAALLAVLLLGLWLLRRRCVAGVGLLWFLVTLLPVAQIVPYTEVLSEHNAYLPLVGLCLAAGDGVARVALRKQLWASVAATLLVGLLSVRSYVRSADWRSEETLWRATLEVAPRSLRAHYNLGIALRRERRWQEAEAHFARAVEIDPRDVDSLVALAEVRSRLGDHRSAVQIARLAVQITPNVQGYVVLGWARLSLGAPFAARRAFQKALELDGGSEDALRGLAAVRKKLRPHARIRPDAGDAPSPASTERRLSE